MDILDILLDILLKPPQPLMGLFLVFLMTYPVFIEKIIKLNKIIKNKKEHIIRIVFLCKIFCEEQWLSQSFLSC